MVDRMIEEGLVRKEHCKTDKRMVNVVICRKGRECLKKIYGNARDTIADWTNGYSDEEVSDVAFALDTLLRLMNRVNSGD